VDESKKAGPGVDRRFWDIDSVADHRVVDAVLRARFPLAFEILEGALDEADPLDVVYPGNPHEYGGVVQEIIVLLAPEGVALDRISPARIEEVLRRALARCFGERPDDSRVRRAVELIAERRERSTTEPGER
jgi:hypothetical protein